MKKILITGGPVHAYLDDIKIITNKFKGGLIAGLADQLYCYHLDSTTESEPCEIHYLTSKGSKTPIHKEIKIIYHNGIDDYMDKVLKLAPDMDAVVLGAAVVNLIPKNKIEGKFPSHDYNPGDTIPIDFTIAPRIIDEVKKVNPKVYLFGFKLLSGAKHDELIKAAYGVLLESKAVTVFANDATDLMQKYAVTKERGVHPIDGNCVCQWIIERIHEKYYKTTFSPVDYIPASIEVSFMKLVKKYEYLFTHTPEGYIFGSVAKRIHLEGTLDKVSFSTTIRGKNETDGFTIVEDVDHNKLLVSIPIGCNKASLNAPLLHKIFKIRKDVDHIVHYHGSMSDLISREYATPGTDKDSSGSLYREYPSFNIKGHGCIMSFDKEGKLIR